jgi:hypothetical protein
MKKKMSVPTVQYTVLYQNQSYFYTEHFNSRGLFMKFTISDSNNQLIDEDSELFDKIMDFLEGTFFEEYRTAMY